MPNISVSVVDGNNITLVTTPTPTQVITIDRGIAGPAGPAGVPGGSNTQVQYNSASNFAGSPKFTFDGTTRFTSANISDGVAADVGPETLFPGGAFIVEAQESAPTGCFMRPDGLAFYVIGSANDRIQYYSLSFPWYLTATGTYVSQSPSVVGQTSAAQDVFFSPDGLNVYIVGSTAPASIFQYSLSVPWDISTLTYTSASVDISSYSTAPTAICLSLDGNFMYVASNTGATNDLIHVWFLATAYSIVGASYQGYISVSGQETVPTALAFSNDGLRMFVVGSSGDDFNVYKLTTAWNIFTATFFAAYNFPGGNPSTPTGMCISPDGEYIYVINDTVGNATVATYLQTTTNWNATGNLNANGNLAVYQNFSVAGKASLWQASLSSGTVNGVAYLNSTKQITAGTALSFNGSKFEVASATGSATPVPTEVRISTTTSASDWSTALPWGRLGYYSADVSASGPKLIASIDVISTATSGGNSALAFNTADNSGVLTERMRIVAGADGSVGIGTATPNAKVEILNTSAGAVATQLFLHNASDTDGTGARLDFAGLASGIIPTASITNVRTGAGAYALTFSNYGGGSNTERMRLDNAGNLSIFTGALLPYTPAPAATISAAATPLTNAQILPQIIVTSGTTFTLTMPLGTTLETLVSWSAVNIAFNFTVINTASGTITMAVNTGVTAVGTLTVLTGISANFRLRRTAANTFIMYRV